MSEPFVQFAFSAGVLSEAFLARPDLEKFDLGLRKGTNWLIDYRGGATVRPPLTFLDYTRKDAGAIRLQPFQFNARLANTYIIVLGHRYMQFMQDGSYVLADEHLVDSISSDNPAVVTTVVSNPFNAGDLVKLSTGDRELDGLLFEIEVLSSLTFSLKTPDGQPYDTTGKTFSLSSPKVARVYTIDTPYSSDDLQDLVFDQFRDEVNITSTKYKPRKLRRLGNTNWELEETEFGGNTANPTTIDLTASDSGTSALAYAVTTVNRENQESPLETVAIVEDIVNFSTTEGSVKVKWSAVPNVNRYNIYRTIFTPTEDMTFTQPFGLLGEAFGPQFIDNNIVPDFTRVPPIPDNPFADGTVLSVEITDTGSGYNKDNTTVSISEGSGFSGLPVVDEAGEVTAVRVLSGGSGYSDGVVSFGGDGTGAEASIRTSPSSGNNPQCSARVQQRRVYGGTENLPMNIFGSVPGAEEDFSFTATGSATDAFDLSLDSEQLTPIKFITPASIGFFAFTEQGVFQVRGTDDSIITAETAIAEPKTQIGCGDVPPLRIKDGVLFLAQGSIGVYGLQPSNLPNYFQLEDNSIYSSQYFTAANPVCSWAYADIPDKVLWACRGDGSFLSMTYLPEQNVQAWSDHATNGYIESIASVRENNYDRVYLVVRREREGQLLRYIERLDLNLSRTREDLWAVDSAVFVEPEQQPGEITPSKATGSDAVFSASDAVFSSSDVGKHIRCGNGRALITNYQSSTLVSADIELPITDLAPESGEPRTYADWTLGEKVTEVDGLWHLEGTEVQIVADGGVEAPQTVQDGSITLQHPASRIAIGFQYTGELVTLPLKSEAGLVLDKKKRPVDVSVRVLNSRGLLAGALGSNRFYAFKERTFEDYGIPTKMQSGMKEVAVVADWSEDAGLVIRKESPLRATVLGFVLNSEVGLD